MKVFVTGVAGQLGHDVVNELIARGIEAVGSDLAPSYQGAADGTAVCSAPYVPLDITDENAVRRALGEAGADALIHCAAWTAVDAAEDEENREKVEHINTDGTLYLAKACAACDMKMMYISTDYVFDGQGEAPWKPDCTDYAPLNVYGKTKLGGELAVAAELEKFFIVRIAWVFGQNGNNFIKTMLRVAKTHERLSVVSDQIGAPTYTYDLAKLLCDMIVTEKYGYYHATNSGGYISWYDFAVEIFRQAEALGHAEYSADRLRVAPVTTAEYGISKAARPFNSRLDTGKLVEAGFELLPDWRDALGRYLGQLEF